MVLTKKGAATKAKAAARKASGTPTYTGGGGGGAPSKKQATLEYMGPSRTPTRYYSPPASMKIERGRDIGVSSSFAPPIATGKVSFPGGLTAMGEATKAKVATRQARGFQSFLGRGEAITYGEAEVPSKKEVTMAEAPGAPTPGAPGAPRVPGVLGGVGTAVGGFTDSLLGGAGGEEGEGLKNYLPLVAIVGIAALAFYKKPRKGK